MQLYEDTGGKMEGATIFFGIWALGTWKSWSDITNRRGLICSRFSEETVKNLNENVAKKLGVSLILAYFTIGATLIKAVLWLAIRITDGI